jgi:hypothetical protein
VVLFKVLKAVSVPSLYLLYRIDMLSLDAMPLKNDVLPMAYPNGCNDVLPCDYCIVDGRA